MTAVRLAEPADAGDLRTLLDRLRWLHEQAGPRPHHEPAARLVALGQVLALHADTPFDTLALRGLALAEPASFDLTVSLADLAPNPQTLSLELPDRQLAAPDLALLPPRSGWSQVGEVGPDEVEDEGADRDRNRDPPKTLDLELDNLDRRQLFDGGR